MDEFSPIRVSTLRGDLKIPFDVYVKVAGKFIHYCRAGDSFEGKRLDRLRAKKLKNLFIRPEDQIPYDQYLEENIEQAYDLKSKKSLDVRVDVIQGFQLAVSEDYMENPGDEAYYHHLRSSVQRFVEFLDKEPTATTPVLKIDNNDLSVAHHSVNVATLTVAMAANSPFKDSTKLHLLGLGCMLHDIEHIHTPIDLSRPLETLSREELAAYKTHPLDGAKRLQKATFIDQIVMNVITQHEECTDGSGFPKGLYQDDIEPVVLLASVADTYDRMVSFYRKEPKEAMKSLMIDKMGALPLEHLKNLNTQLKNFGITT